MQILMIILLALGAATGTTLVAWIAAMDGPEDTPEEERLHLHFFETEEL